MFDSTEMFKIGCNLTRAHAALVRGEPLPRLMTDEEADRLLSKRIQDEDVPLRLLADLDVAKI